MPEFVTENIEYVLEWTVLLGLVASLIGVIRAWTKINVYLSIIEQKIELLKDDQKGFEQESREHRGNLDARLGRVERTMWNRVSK